MTLLNKVTTNTIHFSDIQFQLRADTKWYRILILLLYLTVQLDLRTVTNWKRSYLQCSQHNV